MATDDGRVYLETHSTRYDAIFLDAYRQPYIPFQLTTQEFWSLVGQRLNRGGLVMANLGRIPSDDQLARAIAGTAATEFPSVYLWQAMPFNDIMFGLRPADVDCGRARPAGPRAAEASCPPPCTLPASTRLHHPPIHSPTTGRRVEWMTDGMIVQYAADGSG